MEFIMRNSPPLALILLTATALLGLACAPLHSPANGMGALRAAPPDLEAQGPGTVFSSAEAAAVDALTYFHLQALDARQTGRMRAGTIHRVGDGYSYDEVHLAGALSRHQVRYTLKPQDVARFHSYPRVNDFVVNRANERPSRVDRRSVSQVDPLHRPLYILHPSLVIREYRGEDHELLEVANLRRPDRAPLFAGR